MGLTTGSTGISVLGDKKEINSEDKIIALAGNPNVGKSTVFNGLTGMKQHTGNWTGKTVTTAQGYFKSKNSSFLLVDIPGTYSLKANSAEEECARDFICFKNPDAVVVVCDAVCLERNLNLALQIMETGQKILVCVNLLDEARRKGIYVDLNALEKELGVKVVGTSAKNKKTLKTLIQALENVDEIKNSVSVKYTDEIEFAVSLLEPIIKSLVKDKLNSRWLALKIISKEDSVVKAVKEHLGIDLFESSELNKSLKIALEGLEKSGIKRDKIGDVITSQIINKAQKISQKSIKRISSNGDRFDRRLDRILTGRITAFPIMLCLLAIVLWITVVGANYPSEWLSVLFSKLEMFLRNFLIYINSPDWFIGITVDGAYKVLSWVVAVMLPPMAIFFPFFTLLEDFGYLPRIAYNLDLPFKKCSACGKQALTLCMGFGCNAAGVTGCRIIDSKRERLMAVLTNSFVPCNGRFPALIAVITMFFTISVAGISNSLFSAMFLCFAIVFSVVITLLANRFLSKTFLKGMPSSFVLELPPYRKPRIAEIIVRSVFDRTLFVLGRAVCVAIPAGVVIWLLGNLFICDKSLLIYIAEFLEPVGRFFGMDGVILIAFILGFPANEIVIPLMIMTYTASNTLMDISNYEAVKELFINNGWNSITAICVIIFILFHWPCSTTLLTVKKETGSIKWTVLAFVLPTVTGLIMCAAVNFIGKLFF